MFGSEGVVVDRFYGVALPFIERATEDFRSKRSRSGSGSTGATAIRRTPRQSSFLTTGHVPARSPSSGESSTTSEGECPGMRVLLDEIKKLPVYLD